MSLSTTSLLLSRNSDLKQTLSNLLIGAIQGPLTMCCVYPIDSFKTILQVKNEAKQNTSILSTIKTHIKTKGFFSLYNGISAAAVRAMIFGCARMGLYFSYSDYLKKIKGNAKSISFLESVIGSMISGAIGMALTMPFDMIYVRNQADHALPVNQRRNYHGLVDALVRITKEEGISAFYRGIIPGVVRGMAFNAGMLVPYEKCKHFIANWLGYTKQNYLLSSLVAGFSVAFCVLPFDNAKMKMQKMKPDANGKMPYRGLFNCLAKTVKHEGIMGLWTGYFVFYMVAAPASMLGLLITDGIRILTKLTKT